MPLPAPRQNSGCESIMEKTPAKTGHVERIVDIIARNYAEQGIVEHGPGDLQYNTPCDRISFTTGTFNSVDLANIFAFCELPLDLVLEWIIKPRVTKRTGAGFLRVTIWIKSALDPATAAKASLETRKISPIYIADPRYLAFFDAMMAKINARGDAKWNNKAEIPFLEKELTRHAERGNFKKQDWVDVANFAMFLHLLGHDKAGEPGNEEGKHGGNGQ